MQATQPIFLSIRFRCIKEHRKRTVLSFTHPKFQPENKSKRRIFHSHQQLNFFYDGIYAKYFDNENLQKLLVMVKGSLILNNATL